MESAKDKKHVSRPRTARILASGFVALSVALIVFLLRIDRGPTYQGRSITSWLKEAATTTNGTLDVEVFAKMGTEAVPVELGMLSGDSVKFDAWYYRHFQRFPAWLQRWAPNPYDPRILQVVAYIAFKNNPHVREHMDQIVQFYARTNSNYPSLFARIMENELKAGLTSCIPESVRTSNAGPKGGSSSETNRTVAVLKGSTAPALRQCLIRTMVDLTHEDQKDTCWVQLYAARSLMMMDTNNLSLVTNVFQRTMLDIEPEVRMISAITYLNWCEPTSNNALDVLTDLAAGRMVHWDSQAKQLARERAEDMLVDYFQRRTDLLGVLKYRSENGPDIQLREVNRTILQKIHQAKQN